MKHISEHFPNSCPAERRWNVPNNREVVSMPAIWLRSWWTQPLQEYKLSACTCTSTHFCSYLPRSWAYEVASGIKDAWLGNSVVTKLQIYNVCFMPIWEKKYHFPATKHPKLADFNYFMLISPNVKFKPQMVFPNTLQIYQVGELV